MALSLWWILISAVSGQSTFGVGEIQVLPRVNDSDTGSVTFREKRANGTNTAAFSAPDSITSTYRLRLPASSAAGALTNDGSGNLSWETVSAGPYVNIMDYGAVNDCSSTISNVGGAWDLAYAALGNNGGVIYFPPGCYGINTTLNVGNGTSSSVSTKHSVTMLGAGVSTASANAGATIIRWIGSAPGVDTPMVKFFGPIQGGGIRDLQLDANSTTLVSGIHQFNHVGGEFSNVAIIRPRASPMWFVWTNHASIRSERNHYSKISMSECGAGSGGMYFDTDASAATTRDNFVGGATLCYDGSNSAVYYGIRLRYTERNTFTGLSLAPYLGSGTSSYGIWMDGYSGNSTYPQLNVFDGVYSETGPGAGAFGAGGGGNLFAGLSPNVPNTTHMKGTTAGGDIFGAAGNPPKVLGSHDIGSDTLALHQQSGAYNSGGSLAFIRQGTTVGRIQYESFSGLTFSTYNLGGGSLFKWWKINQDGIFEPESGGTAIGRTSNRIPAIYSSFLDTQTVGSDLNPASAGFNVGTTANPWAASVSRLFTSINLSGVTTVSVDGASGGITASGLINAAQLQASSGATLHNVAPYIGGSSSIGSSGAVFNEAYLDNVLAITDISVGPVGNAKVYMSGVPYGLMYLLNSSNAVTIQMDAQAGQIVTTGLITGNGFRSGASTGVSLTCGGGQKIVNPQVVGGIVVAGTCGF